jgi:hypothetical protein
VVRDPQPSIDYQPEDVPEMNADDWKKMQQMIDDAVKKVWSSQMEVTKGNGEKKTLSHEQVIQETYQKVAKKS